MDSFPYLPSRKTLERQFGGVVAMRNELKLSGPNNFSAGITRSAVAKDTFINSQKYELDFLRSQWLPLHKNSLFQSQELALDHSS